MKPLSDSSGPRGTAPQTTPYTTVEGVECQLLSEMNMQLDLEVNQFQEKPIDDINTCAVAVFPLEAPVTIPAECQKKVDKKLKKVENARQATADKYTFWNFLKGNDYKLGY